MVVFTLVRHANRPLVPSMGTLSQFHAPPRSPARSFPIPFLRRLTHTFLATLIQARVHELKYQNASWKLEIQKLRRQAVSYEDALATTKATAQTHARALAHAQVAQAKVT